MKNKRVLNTLVGVNSVWIHNSVTVINWSAMLGTLGEREQCDIITLNAKKQLGNNNPARDKRTSEGYY